MPLKPSHNLLVRGSNPCRGHQSIAKCSYIYAIVFLADVTSTSRWRKDGAILLGVRGPVSALLQRDVDDFIRLPFQSHPLAWLLSALENLERLRQPGLSAKRSLALREFALGMEGLDGLFSASLCDVCMKVSSAMGCVKIRRRS